jgi:hypothetical protein
MSSTYKITSEPILLFEEGTDSARRRRRRKRLTTKN